MDHENVGRLIWGGVAVSLGAMWAWASTRPDPPMSDVQKCFLSCRRGFQSEHDTTSRLKCIKNCTRMDVTLTTFPNGCTRMDDTAAHPAEKKDDKMKFIHYG